MANGARAARFLASVARVTTATLGPRCQRRERKLSRSRRALRLPPPTPPPSSTRRRSAHLATSVSQGRNTQLAAELAGTRQLSARRVPMIAKIAPPAHTAEPGTTRPSPAQRAISAPKERRSQPPAGPTPTTTWQARPPGPLACPALPAPTARRRASPTIEPPSAQPGTTVLRMERRRRRRAPLARTRADGELQRARTAWFVRRASPALKRAPSLSHAAMAPTARSAPGQPRSAAQVATALPLGASRFLAQLPSSSRCEPQTSTATARMALSAAQGRAPQLIAPPGTSEPACGATWMPALGAARATRAALRSPERILASHAHLVVFASGPKQPPPAEGEGLREPGS